VEQAYATDSLVLDSPCALIDSTAPK
jgi:hypothetical protein